MQKNYWWVVCEDWYRCYLKTCSDIPILCCVISSISSGPFLLHSATAADEDSNRHCNGSNRWQIAAATGTATVSTSAAVGTIGAKEDVVVSALVILPAFAVDAAVGGLAQALQKLFGMW